MEQSRPTVKQLENVKRKNVKHTVKRSRINKSTELGSYLHDVFCQMRFGVDEIFEDNKEIKSV